MIQNGNENPTLAEAVDYVIQQALANVNTGLPGRVVKYADTGLADIQIEVAQLYEDGESLVVPPLTNVPVERIRSNQGNAYLVTPIKVGDTGWIKFSQRTIDNWTIDGKTQEMNTLRMFDLSDAVFFPGLWPTNAPIEEGNENLVLRNEDARHIILPKGHELNTTQEAFIRINEDRISAGNKEGEVLSLINDLLAQLIISYGVSPVGPAPLDPTSVTEITRIQTVLAKIREP